MRARTSAALAALLIVLPSALAATGTAAVHIEVLGDARLSSDLQAVFLVVEERGVSWQATAATVVVERHYVERVLVPGVIIFTPPSEGDWKTETITLADADLESVAARQGGAMLSRGDATVLATSPTGLSLASATDPRLDQGAPPEAETSEGNVMQIHEQLSGIFLASRLDDGSLELRGDITLDIRDVDYAATSDGARSSFRTGRYTTQDAVAAATVREEYQTVTLIDAVLRFDAVGPVDLYAKQAELTLDGDMLLDGAAHEGLLEEGRGTLGLLAESGLVRASRSEAFATQSAAPSPFALPFTIPLVAALALAAAIVVLARRTRRDDVELALLAMTERRWRDALPRLERALRQEPENATLLLDRAICLEMVGKLTPAARAYEATLRRAPRSAEAHFYLARTLAKLQQPEPGTVHLQTALELDPRLVEMARAESAFRAMGVSR